MAKNRIFLLSVALGLAAGCALQPPNPRLIMRYEKGLETTDLRSLLMRAGGGPVAVMDLGRTAWVSHHLAVVRDAEAPHYHRFHDLTVSVLRGEGVIDIEGKRFAMKAGDVVHVQRGIRHYFRNTGKDPAAAFVIFSPPYDGRDTVTAEVPAAEQPPAEEPKSWWKFWGRGAPHGQVEEAHPLAVPEEPH